MSGITQAQAQASLDAALAAHQAIMAGGTEYRQGDVMLKCPPLTEVLQSINYWQGLVQRLATSGTAARGPRIFGACV